MDKALQELIDRQAITDLMHRYCRSMDRCDHEIGYSIWHEGAEADYGPMFQGKGRDLIDHFLMRHLNHCVAHSHQITVINIALDGDRAGSESYVFATIRTENDGKTLHRLVWGRYLDELERRNGRWGIVKRTYVHDFDEVREATPMAEGWGRRDKSDASYGVLDVARRTAVPA